MSIQETKPASDSRNRLHATLKRSPGLTATLLLTTLVALVVVPTASRVNAQGIPPPPSGNTYSGYPAPQTQQPAAPAGSYPYPPPQQAQNQYPYTTGQQPVQQPYAQQQPLPPAYAQQPAQPAQVVSGVGGTTQPRAGSRITLKEAVGKALQTNPEVLESYHLFRAAVEDVNIARADFFPTLDYTGDIGKQKDYESGYDVGETVQGSPATSAKAELTVDRYTRSTPYSLTLNQMIFEGFATVNAVRQYGKSKVKAYYDLLSASESMAAQTAEAFYEVIRYRLRLGLTEDFYVLHRSIYEQISRRVQQGVGKRVDQDQAASRLALAESNVTTEAANLHDRSSRFLRLVGELPADSMFGPGSLSGAMPSSEIEAQRIGFLNNPAMRSAVEEIMVYQYAQQAARGSFYPQIGITANTRKTDNLNDIPTINKDTYIEANANWNLFRGGGDLALVRKQGALKYAAFDLREKACRDLRQSLSIAYNNTFREQHSLESTNNQVILLERARDAYREQYDIGQRSLLDLLDTENELFNARLSAVDAETNLAISFIQTYQYMGKLLDFLGFFPGRDDEDAPSRDDLEEMHLEDMCPVAAPYNLATDLAELDRRALASVPTQAPQPIVAPSVERITLSADALFRLGKADLLPAGRRELDEFADKYASLSTKPTSIRVIGYTDRLGSESYNYSLSERRAASVRNYMTRQGIPGSIVSTEGRGEANPVTAGSCNQRPESGKNRALVDCLAPDRRVEVEVR